MANAAMTALQHDGPPVAAALVRALRAPSCRMAMGAAMARKVRSLTAAADDQLVPQLALAPADRLIRVDIGRGASRLAGRRLLGGGDRGLAVPDRRLVADLDPQRGGRVLRHRGEGEESSEPDNGS